MKTIFLFLATLTFLTLSCGSDPVSDEISCSPSCKSWEKCIEGECKLKENSCASNNDCKDAGSVCNLTTNLCELSQCAELCEGWEDCNADTGTCEIKNGRCDEKSICKNPSKPVCSEQHYCVEESDDCKKTCESDNDCGADDICDPFEKI